MSVAIRAITRLQDADDAPSLGAGQDGYALTWDNASGAFVMAAVSGVYLPLAGGTMTGALDFNYQGASKLYANVLTVNAAGGADYTTITAAIAAAIALTPGVANLVAIMVYPGTYTETWTLPQYVSLIAPGGGVVCTSAAIAGPIFTFAGAQSIVNIRFQAAQNATYKLCLVTDSGSSFYNCQMYGYAMGSATTCYALRFEDPDAFGLLYLFNCVISIINYGTPSVTIASALSVAGYPSAQTVNAYNTSFLATRLTGSGSYRALYSQVDLTDTYFGCTISGTSYAVYCGNTISLVGGSLSGATSQPVVFTDNVVHRGISNLASTVTTMSAAAATDKLLILKGAAAQTANLQEWQDANALALASVSAAGAGLFQPEDAATNTVTNGLTVGHNTTGTAANGFGAGQLFALESSTTAAQDAARIQALWYEATHATRKADLVLTAYDTAEREGLRIRGAGSAPAIGFLGAAPVGRQAHVADPAGGGTVDAEARSAINSILATLENFGLHATS